MKSFEDYLHEASKTEIAIWNLPNKNSSNKEAQDIYGAIQDIKKVSDKDLENSLKHSKQLAKKILRRSKTKHFSKTEVNSLNRIDKRISSLFKRINKL
jgi:hypothetical protein